MPRCRSDVCLEQGLSLLEVLIYTVVLSFLLLAVYQTNSFVQQQSIRGYQVSQLNFDHDSAIDEMRRNVQLSQEPIRIQDQSQPSGAPSEYGQGNCILMRRSVAGVLTDYTVSLRYDAAAGAARLVLNNGASCSDTPDHTAPQLSAAIFKPEAATPWFVGRSGADAAGGFREVDFQYQAFVGAGSVSTGTALRRARLSISALAQPDCRVASPDASWFTDYGTQRIRTATVSFTLNFDSAADRLSLLGSPTGLTVTALDSIGVLHLYDPSGRTVSQWLALLTDVAYTRVTGAAAVTEATPPKRVSFALGDGLPFAPAGTPSNHFYFAIQLGSAQTFLQSDGLAKSICYPAFASDAFLGVNSRPASPSSCDSGSYPRLTGHPVTLTTEGEHEFLKAKVLQMVYPQTNMGSDAFSGATRNPSSGRFWMGGYFGSKVGGGGDETFRWIRGFEMSKNGGDHNDFASPDGTPRSGDAAGKYFSSLYSSPSAAAGQYLHYDVAGSSGRHWNAIGATNTVGLAVIEFGDNRNATSANVTGSPPSEGETVSGDEIALNGALRLKKDVSVVPFEFFRACQ